ncbi:MAG TPA: hypothetical protein VFV43_06570 [Limnobacter sp.]|nr:hypothetical protein [Limnobacter sp.]
MSKIQTIDLKPGLALFSILLFGLGIHSQAIAVKLNLSHTLTIPSVDHTEPSEPRQGLNQPLGGKIFTTAGGVGLKLSSGLGLMYTPRLSRSGFAQSTEGIYLVNGPGKVNQQGIRWFVGIQSSQLQDNRGPGKGTSALSAGLLFSLSP